MKKLIFISSQYSADPEKSIQDHIDVSHQLLDAGYIPVSYVIQSHYTHIDRPHDYLIWLDAAITVMQKCDAVLVLDMSPGVKAEIAEAKASNIPIFYDIDDIEFFSAD